MERTRLLKSCVLLSSCAQISASRFGRREVSHRKSANQNVDTPSCRAFRMNQRTGRRAAKSSTNHSHIRRWMRFSFNRTRWPFLVLMKTLIAAQTGKSHSDNSVNRRWMYASGSFSYSASSASTRAGSGVAILIASAVTSAVLSFAVVVEVSIFFRVYNRACGYLRQAGKRPRVQACAFHQIVECRLNPDGLPLVDAADFEYQPRSGKRSLVLPAKKDGFKFIHYGIVQGQRAGFRRFLNVPCFVFAVEN